MDEIFDLIEKEEGFVDTMHKEIEPCLEGCVKDGYYTGSRSGKLHYRIYYPSTEATAGEILLVHGFSEFVQKYSEMIYHLIKKGYIVYAPELRGHGYSVRETDNNQMVYIDSFKTYLYDLNTFVHQFMNKTSEKKLIIGHSMGGAIVARYAELWPDDFDKVILSSPMICPQTNGIPFGLVKVIASVEHMVGHDKHYVFGHEDFDGKCDLEHSSCLSYERFRYTYGLRVENVMYQTWSATFGWLRAALNISSKIMSCASAINKPTLVMYAGKDTLVKPDNTKNFCDSIALCESHFFPESKHEIFNSVTAERIEFYKTLFEFISR